MSEWMIKEYHQTVMTFLLTTTHGWMDRMKAIIVGPDEVYRLCIPIAEGFPAIRAV